MKHKPRLVFCTYSSLYSSVVLQALLQSDQVEVVGIVNSTRILKPTFSAWFGSLKLIHLTGWRYASYLFCVTDLFRLLRPLSRIKSIHFLAKQQQVPLLDTVDINQPESINFITSLQPDNLLCAHFNQLLKAPILLLPKLSALNIHPSMLPNYKGVDPVFYALLANEPEIGVSVHIMDETFDTGEVLAQRAFSTDASDNLLATNIQLFTEGAGMAIKAISSQQELSPEDKQKSSEVPSTETSSKSSYDSWPSRQDINTFKQQGRQLLSLRQLFSIIFDR